MLRITVSKQGDMPRAQGFDKREITVGRTTANDVVIPEPGVSSSHARILFTGSEITLIDLESTNGTFVNGARIQGPHILRPQDDVFICSHRIEFEVAAGSQPHPAHSTGRPEPSYPHPAAPQSFGEPPMMPSSIGASMPPMAPPSLMPPPSIAVSPGGVPSSVAPPPMAPPPPLAPPPFVGPNGGYEPPAPIGPTPFGPTPLGSAPFGQLGVPSAVGIGGPTPRRSDEPPSMPTLPPPLALDPLPMVDPVLELPPKLPAPQPVDPPARTGSTFTPVGAGLPEHPSSDAAARPATREPPASLEPVGLAPEVV
ncbi:MAG: FHA domain-containing protein, partial [Deltaproteobacteria bacterium]|nr:FHA domain-containing protein [Nannocystaceae bacterium]